MIKTVSKHRNRGKLSQFGKEYLPKKRKTSMMPWAKKKRNISQKRTKGESWFFPQVYRRLQRLRRAGTSSLIPPATCNRDNNLALGGAQMRKVDIAPAWGKNVLVTLKFHFTCTHAHTHTTHTHLRKAWFIALLVPVQILVCGVFLINWMHILKIHKTCQLL